MKKWMMLLALITVCSCYQSNQLADIEWQTFDQTKVRLEDYPARWVVVNYWATWCRPCIREMPVLENYYQRHSSKVMIIGANIEHDDGFVSFNQIIEFTQKLNITFPVVKANVHLDKVSLGKIKALPMTVIISPEREIVYTHIGEIDHKTLNKYISSL